MRRLILVAALAVGIVAGTIAAAAAQEVTGGCRATINEQTPDTLTRTNPLVVAKGDTVALVGTVPASAGSGDVPSQTDIYVEVVGDVPVASEPGNGPSWGGTVTVPNVITQLAPGVYKVKGTATGEGWVCTGSAYVKVEGGPLTVAAGLGALIGLSGAVTATRAQRPKRGQVFADGRAVEAASPEAGSRVMADAVTIGLFAALVGLVGFVGPSWVL
jgi:hypothetical protein